MRGVKVHNTANSPVDTDWSSAYVETLRQYFQALKPLFLSETCVKVQLKNQPYESISYLAKLHLAQDVLGNSLKH